MYIFTLEVLQQTEKAVLNVYVRPNGILCSYSGSQLAFRTQSTVSRILGVIALRSTQFLVYVTTTFVR